MTRGMMALSFLAAIFSVGCDDVSSTNETEILNQNAHDVSINPPFLDLGKVKSGTKIDCHFNFSNNTRYTVQISALRGGCSCLVGGSFPIEVPSYSQSKVPFFFDARGKTDGNFRNKLTVLYRINGIEKQDSLGVFADILGDDYLAATPSSLSFDVSSPGGMAVEERSSRIQLRGRNGEVPGKLSIVAPDWLDVTLVDQSTQSQKEFDWLLSAKVREAGFAGSFYGEIIVNSENEELSTSIPVTARMFSNLDIQPAAVTCSSGSAALLKLRARDGSSLTLKNIEIFRDNGSDVSVLISETGNDYVTFSVSGESNAPLSTGYLLIWLHTQREGRNEVFCCRVPYLFVSPL